MTKRAQYKREYALYLRAVRRMERKYGIEIERRARVKRPTSGSLRALERERELLRLHKWKITDNEQPILEPVNEIPERSSEEIRAEVELSQLTDIIETGLTYSGRKIASEVMVHGAAEEISAIIEDAKNRMSAIEIMEKLRELYGQGLSGIVEALEKLIYAVYNLGGSGYAKWAGRGSRARWGSELARIKGALS